ncbi:MAG: threonine synthase [Gemmatimonadota bacterium]|nr:threonine synthase [Gemmatimonadota bacterium]
MGYLVDLRCTRCGRSHDRQRLWNLSACCEAPLFARYDLEKASNALRKADLPGREPTMWRYEEVLPVERVAHRISLGEGFTPLLKAGALGTRVGVPDLYVKDEGVNPTGSFKARGLSAAISRAAELGANAVAIPSAGNAGGATAAYAARAGMEAYVFMPTDAPAANLVECRRLGARVTLVDGLITDCGKIVADRKVAEGWFDVSTLKEPYRVEGKKTMGYELAEQLDWELPDVVLYPTGGGTGLIGMWKAFDEMEEMGWIGSARPRMVAVQAQGCAPVVRAYETGADSAEFWEDAETVASGLRVPGAVGDFLMLRAIRESRGTAIAVTDGALLACVDEMASSTGIFPAPEGAATLAGLKELVRVGWISSDDRVVLFNTGTGLKYIEAMGAAHHAGI